MRYQGKITNWKDDQGFGFITPDGNGQQVFVHIKSFITGQRRPVVNEIVTYELTTDFKGRARAENVARVGESVPSVAPSKPTNAPLLLAGAFLGFVAGSVLAGKLPSAVLGLYFVASTVAFIAYAIDKSAARNGQWRTQESTLHLFALLGGWPGALAAQRLLHHKSKKRSFQIAFWATVILNCAGFGWLFFFSGAEALRSILGAA